MVSELYLLSVIYSYHLDILLIQETHVDNVSLGNSLKCKFNCEKVQIGKDQEKVQSEKDSHSKNRGGKKTN